MSSIAADDEAAFEELSIGKLDEEDDADEEGVASFEASARLRSEERTVLIRSVQNSIASSLSAGNDTGFKILQGTPAGPSPGALFVAFQKNRERCTNKYFGLYRYCQQSNFVQH